MKNRLVALVPLVALAACGPSRKEHEAAKAALLRAQADLESAKRDAVKLSGEVAAANRAKDEALRTSSDFEAKATSLGKELAAARDGLSAKEAALAAAEQERSRVAQELERAKSAAEAGEKRLADAAARTKQLETALQQRESEVGKARSDAEEARRKLEALLAQPPPPATDALSRLAGEGTEEVPPYQVLPLTFQARKGERLRWAWSIVEGPADLAAGVLDFTICGPDRAKAHGVLAGAEKKGDEGSLEIPADGRWTVAWSNRHPSATFAVRFDVSVKPGS